MTQNVNVVVLISGSGSNLQALIDAAAKENSPFRVSAVISNRDDAFGLQRAAKADIETRVVPHTEFNSREEYDPALMAVIDSFNPDLVVLAGFMRILTDDFVRHYHQKLLNIHPSLLPKHKGLHTHRRAIEEGDSLHGASVHFVTEELDGGPVFLQARLDVQSDDTPESLAARVLQREHLIFPLAVSWFAEGRITLEGNQIFLDQLPLAEPVVFDFS